MTKTRICYSGSILPGVKYSGVKYSVLKYSCTSVANGRHLHDVARAADARDARLFTNVTRCQKAAHQPHVAERTGACQLCSSAMLGEELCFRHTTILGSRR